MSWADTIDRVNVAVRNAVGVSGLYEHTEAGTSETVSIDTHEPFEAIDLGGEVAQGARIPSGDVRIEDLSTPPLKDDFFTPSEGPESGNRLRVSGVEGDGDGQATLRFLRT